MRVVIRSLAALLLAVPLGAAVPAVPPAGANPSDSADPVLVWNVNAVNAVLASGNFIGEGFARMAYVQGAVYDAVVAIEDDFEPYVGHLRSSRGASVPAAVATAAHDVLVALYPAQKAALDTTYQSYLAAVPAGPAMTDGTAVGARAAADLLAARAGDGLGANVPYTFGTGPGAWVLPTDNTAPAALTPQTPWLGQMRPFLLHSSDQFRPEAPPALTSRRYARDLAETQAYGSKTSTVRTPEQTAAAIFWSANAMSMYNVTMRAVTTAHGFDAAETARALAMTDMVGADALITCLEAKYHYSFWRPYTAIRGAASDGNLLTTADPTWVPLLPTPNHPEYPAAHGCETASQGQVFREVLGTRSINLDVIHPVTGAVRHFATTRDLEREIIDVRIWGGLHYRNSGEVGVELGREVARAGLDDHFEADDERDD